MDQGLIWEFSARKAKKKEGVEKKGAYPLENPNTMCSFLLNVTFSFLLEGTPDPVPLPYSPIGMNTQTLTSTSTHNTGTTALCIISIV